MSDSISVTLGGGRSNDLGLIVAKDGIDISQPERVKTMVTIPYMDGAYDFSFLGGKPVYKCRTVKITFVLTGADTNELYRRKCKAVEWLSSVQSGELYISCLDYHFIKAVLTAASFDFISPTAGRLTATFTAYPYMRSPDYADTAFDDFSFEDNCLNQDIITISGGESIKVYSYADRDITPRLSFKKSGGDTAGLTITLNGEKLSELIKGGDTADFALKSGINTISAAGSGTLTLELYEEVL